MKTLLVAIGILVIAAGCSVMPRGVLKEVNRDITLDQVQGTPSKYAGQKVLWGGTILSSENLEKTTEIEVLETKLAFDEAPEEGSSHGRFIIEYPGYLDTNVYTKNKRITVAGTVKGVERRKIGKMDYPYPVLTPIEMRVFDPMKEMGYNNYPYSPYGAYGPYYPYGPMYPLGPYAPYGPFRSPYYPYPYPYPFP